jgi:hypothetical protein
MRTALPSWDRGYAHAQMAPPASLTATMRAIGSAKAYGKCRAASAVFVGRPRTSPSWYASATASVLL